jgi:hypothetical protein
MAKRNTKQGMYQQRQAQPKRRSPAGKSASKASRADSPRSYSREAPPAPRAPARANLLTVRIAAIAIAVAAVVGGVAWMVSLKGAYSGAQVAGLIVLAFLAGLGIVVAIRTEQVVSQVAKIMRERR